MNQTKLKSTVIKLEIQLIEMAEINDSRKINWVKIFDMFFRKRNMTNVVKNNRRIDEVDNANKPKQYNCNMQAKMMKNDYRRSNWR